MSKYDPNCAWYDFSCTSDPSGCAWWDIGCTVATDVNKLISPTEKAIILLVFILVVGVVAIAFSPAAKHIIPKVRVS